MLTKVINILWYACAVPNFVVKIGKVADFFCGRIEWTVRGEVEGGRGSDMARAYRCATEDWNLVGRYVRFRLEA